MAKNRIFKEQQFKSAIALTNISSKKTINALKAHLVDGVRQADCVRQYQVDKGLLSRHVSRLKGVKSTARSVVA